MARNQNRTNMMGELETRDLEKAFDTVMNVVESKWPFDDRAYPQLPKEDKEKTDFITKHLILRMMNAMASIAQYPEARDQKHVSGNYSYLHNGAKMQIVNSFRLAKHLGITGEDIVKYLKEKP